MTAGCTGRRVLHVPRAVRPQHFRTSVHASPLFAGALLRLVERVDAALGTQDVRPGRCRRRAGRAAGHAALAAAGGARRRGPGSRRSRSRRGRPGSTPGSRGGGTCPDGIVGLLIATEWLDNVPLDVADVDDHGRLREVLVDPATGDESLGRGWTRPTCSGCGGGGRGRAGARSAGRGTTAWADAVGRCGAAARSPSTRALRDSGRRRHAHRLPRRAQVRRSGRELRRHRQRGDGLGGGGRPRTG
jgi:hypothetical protein